MDFKQLLKEQFKDLSETSLITLSEAFDTAVKEKAELAVQAEVIKIDEDHSQKLTGLIEAIDKDHTDKLQKLVGAIDKDHAFKFESAISSIDEKHTKMLQAVVDKYEELLKEDSIAYKEELVSSVSDYMDLYIEKLIPANQVSEAVNNIKAKNTLDQIRSLVAVSEEYIDQEVKEALIDGKKIIDSLRKELNEAVKGNVELNTKLGETKSLYLLEQKTKALAKDTKAYVEKLLKNKSPEFIQENFQYVVEMFESQKTEQEENAKEKIMEKRTQGAIDRPIFESISEEIVTNPSKAKESAVGEYLNAMKRNDGSRFQFR